MKPAWDGLMEEFKGHKSILVADVDCTAAGKSLCEANGVRGYPTIKHGDPANLEDYKGGRDAAALKKFTGELKPACSPANIALCDEADKAKIDTIAALSDEEIDKFIADGEADSAKAESDFQKAVEALQAQYKSLMEKKDATLAEIKEKGVGLYKAVRAHKKVLAGAPASKKEEL